LTRNLLLESIERGPAGDDGLKHRDRGGTVRAEEYISFDDGESAWEKVLEGAGDVLSQKSALAGDTYTMPWMSHATATWSDRSHSTGRNIVRPSSGPGPHRCEGSDRQSGWPVHVNSQHNGCDKRRSRAYLRVAQPPYGFSLAAGWNDEIISFYFDI